MNTQVVRCGKAHRASIDMNVRMIGIAVLIMALGAAVGCRTAPPPGSLDREAEAREGTFKQEWKKSGVDFRRFRKIQVRDLDMSGVKEKASLFPKFEFESLDRKDSPKLQRVFRREFEKELRAAGYIVRTKHEKVSSDTLVMAPRLLEVETPVIWLNALTTLVIGPLSAGGATFEADFFDGSGDVAEVGETQSGAWHLGSVLIGGYQKTYDTERVFTVWAKRTVSFLKGG